MSNIIGTEYEPFADIKNENDYYANFYEMASNILKFKNLPESIPEYILMYHILSKNTFCFIEYEGDVYIISGDFGGGELDFYYRNNFYIVNNLKLGTKELKWKGDEECVLVRTSNGFKPFCDIAGFKHYSALLEEAWEALKIDLKNTKLTRVFRAVSEKEKAAVEMALEAADEGKPFVALIKNAYGDSPNLTESLKVDDAGIINQVMEAITFTNGMALQSMGLAAQTIMKKERLITAEVQNQYPSLKVNITDLFKHIQDGVERCNKKYGTNIEVELNPLWYPAENIDATIPETDESEEIIDEQENVEASVTDIGTSNQSETDEGTGTGTSEEVQQETEKTDDEGLQEDPETSTGGDSETDEVEEVEDEDENVSEQEDVSEQENVSRETSIELNIDELTASELTINIEVNEEEENQDDSINQTEL